MKKIFGLSLLGVLALASIAAAAEGAAPATAGISESVKVVIALAAGFGIAIASAFGALSQAKGLSTALDGIARNPNASGKIVTPMIIGLAMIESLVIYSLVISLMLVLKL